MLDSPHTSLDSRLRGNDMNSCANVCNQPLVASPTNTDAAQGKF